MKRALLAILILSAATVLFSALRNAAATDGHDLANLTAAWQTQTQQLARLTIQKQQLVKHLDEARQTLAAQPALPPLDRLQQKVLSGAPWRSFSPAECEQLLAELGFNWNTTGDYLIISKKSLDSISFNAMHGDKLTSTAAATLALTDDEQAAINTMTGQLMAARLAWDKDHLQRTEPGGNILAQYSLPVDTDLAQSQIAVFTNGIYNTLGAQRAQLLQNQSAQWMQDHGLVVGPDLSSVPADLYPQLPDSARNPQPTTMTLESYQAGDEMQITVRLQEAGGTMTTSISPWQPVPAAFSALFPGGWPEIAQREGFQLPKSFYNQK